MHKLSLPHAQILHSGPSVENFSSLVLADFEDILIFGEVKN